MDSIKKLKEIGLQKISLATHIEEKYLKYMIECNYEKLSRINTLGFIKIISREYNLDLSDWLADFETYWLENRSQDTQSEKLFIFVKEEKESSKKLKFILLAVTIALLAIVFSIFKDDINLQNFQNTQAVNYEPNSIVLETQKSLEEINQSVENLTNNFGYNEIAQLPDANLTQQAIAIQESIQADDKMIEQNALEQNTSEVIIPDSNASLTLPKQLTLSPKINLWLGIVYLDDQSRKSYIGKSDVILDLSRDQIITTGHGSFVLSGIDYEKDFSIQAPVRFLVKDGNLAQITGDEFKELNGGKVW